MKPRQPLFFPKQTVPNPAAMMPRDEEGLCADDAAPLMMGLFCIAIEVKEENRWRTIISPEVGTELCAGTT